MGNNTNLFKNKNKNKKKFSREGIQEGLNNPGISKRWPQSWPSDAQPEQTVWYAKQVRRPYGVQGIRFLHRISTQTYEFSVWIILRDISATHLI